MENSAIKEIYTRQDESNLELIRKELKQGHSVRVHNAYETFYGYGFDKWLKSGLVGINCDIQIEAYDKFEGFPKSFMITPKN